MNGLQITAITDRGVVRSNNEDCVYTDLHSGIAILADGMGGHQAGEVASRMATDVINQHLQEALINNPKAKPGKGLEKKAVGEAILLANSAIFEVSRTRPDCAGMGSTVVVALFYEDQICIGHVGDSRLYRLRDNEFTQLTEDHSVVQELLSRGLITPEEAKTAYNKNLVTRALGVDQTVKPDVAEHQVMDKDVYLMCSDGLNDVLQDDAIQQLLQPNGAQLPQTASRMVEEVNRHGGPDNVSIILARTGSRFQRGGQ